MIYWRAGVESGFLMCLFVCFEIIMYFSHYLFLISSHITSSRLISSHLILSFHRDFFFLQAPSSSQKSGEQNQHLRSSTEVTVDVSIPDEGNYETVNETIKEHTYAVVDKSNRKSRLDEKEPPTHVQESSIQRPSGNAYLTPTDHPATAEAGQKCENAESESKQKEGRKGCVYVVVYINSELGNTTVCKEPTIQGERLEMKCTPRQPFEDGNSVELVNVSSFENGKEFEMTDSKAEAEKNSNSGEGRKEDLYAVVDKTKKKRRPPQVLAMSPTSMRVISYHVRMYISTKLINFRRSLSFEMSLVHHILCNRYLGTNSVPWERDCSFLWNF